VSTVKSGSIDNVHQARIGVKAEAVAAASKRHMSDFRLLKGSHPHRGDGEQKNAAPNRRSRTAAQHCACANQVRVFVDIIKPIWSLSRYICPDKGDYILDKPKPKSDIILLPP
jgi:hypothetical protein